MRIRKKLAPTLSKEIVSSLRSSGAVEIEERMLEDAEIDIAAVLIEHVNANPELDAAGVAKMIDHMVEMRYVEEVFAEDSTIRREIQQVLTTYV